MVDLLISDNVTDSHSTEEEDPDHMLDMPDVPSHLQRMVVVTTDNASNISVAITHSSMNHVRCFAHCVNLAVQKFVKEMDTGTSSSIARIRSIVRYFHNSSAATDILKVSR